MFCVEIPWEQFINPSSNLTLTMVPSFLINQKMSFCKKIKSVQYKAALAITEAILSTSREKSYKELGFETLKPRRWLKKLCCFYKIKNNGIPSYLAELIPESHLHNTRNNKKCYNISFRTDAFKYSFSHGQ